MPAYLNFKLNMGLELTLLLAEQISKIDDVSTNFREREIDTIIILMNLGKNGGLGRTLVCALVL